MNSKGIPLLSKESGRDALKKACRKAGIKIGVIEALVEVELEQVGKLRKAGITERFDEILGDLVDDKGD